MVDSTTQALMRFRAGNFISLNSDEEFDDESTEIVAEYY
jgi:hypothetical protein